MRPDDQTELQKSLKLSQFDRQWIHKIRNALVVIQGNNELMGAEGQFDKVAYESIQIGVDNIADILKELESLRREL